jgi:hypothetical protein
VHFVGSVINRLGVKSSLYIVGTPVGTVVIPSVRSISEKFRWIVERCNTANFQICLL